MSLVIRDAEVEGRRRDVRIEDGRIAEVGERLRGREDLDARGGALIPGLVDHHIHLLGLAAQADGVALDDAADAREVERRLRAGLAGREPGRWLRATGYHERAGLLDRARLDAIAPRHPVRVQHQSGALWVLNSAAMALLGEDLPDCVEPAAGHIWRGDAWLSGRIGRTAPPLAPVGAMLAAHGVTGVMDASATTTAETTRLIAAAGLPQRVGLMSAAPLPPGEGWRVGPVKVLLDEHDLPDFDDMLERIAAARAQGRRVAVHCVTAAELAFTLAAFETAGTLPGDRLEHGGVIAPEAIEAVARLGLTVVTQPAFIAERGDRYLAEVDPEDHDSLYRCAGLMRAGVPVAGSSDAPYVAADPWAGMRAAVARRTREGRIVGEAERLAPDAALGLFLGSLERPGVPRRIEPGAAADLCLLAAPMRTVLAELDAGLVAATFVGGRVVHAVGAWEAAA